MVAPIRSRCGWLRLTWRLLCQHAPVCVQLNGRVYVYGSALLALRVLGLDLGAPPYRVREFAYFTIPRLRLFCHCARPFLAAVPSSGAVIHLW